MPPFSLRSLSVGLALHLCLHVHVKIGGPSQKDDSKMHLYASARYSVVFIDFIFICIKRALIRICVSSMYLNNIVVGIPKKFTSTEDVLDVIHVHSFKIFFPQGHLGEYVVLTNSTHTHAHKPLPAIRTY